MKSSSNRNRASKSNSPRGDDFRTSISNRSTSKTSSSDRSTTRSSNARTTNKSATYSTSKPYQKENRYNKENRDDRDNRDSRDKPNRYKPNQKQEHLSHRAVEAPHNITPQQEKPLHLLGEKLHKILSRSGVASRREIERMIQEKRVSVNGVIATLGDRLNDLNALVRVDGRQVRLMSTQQTVCRVLAYNKDEGEICTRQDPEGRRTIYERLPILKDARWVAIGRLDINTSGLILLTTDGELANQLMHPSRQIEREYAVRIFGDVSAEMIKNLVSGVALEDGVARFEDVVYAGGEGTHHNFYVVITEGRNREVRRLWESQGVMVSRLKRVRYGSIVLDKMLPKSGWAELPLNEVNYLRELASLQHERSSVIPVKQRDVNPRHKKHQINKAIRRHEQRTRSTTPTNNRQTGASHRRSKIT